LYSYSDENCEYRRQNEGFLVYIKTETYHFAEYDKNLKNKPYLI